MASVGKSSSRINKRETRSPSDKKLLGGCEEISSSSSYVGEEDHSPALNGHDIQSLAITAQDLERLRVPKPPSDSQKPKSMTRVYVRKTRPPDEVSRAVRVTIVRPLPQDVAPPQLFEYAGPGGPRFDSQGMVLPHSILGSLEDFRTEMQLRGETELVQRIPDRQERPPLWVEDENEDNKAGVHSETGRGHQSHALQHWGRHMTERHRQQDFISRFLQKPAGSLLMNRSSTFRRVQEQRDLISTALPALSAGHGHRVGSEFWSVPQHYGDETSGITATLTQTERGKRPAVTRVAQPLSTRLESGNVACEAVNGGWDQGLYLQQRLHELKDVLRDFSPPEADGLEVVGSGLPVSSRSPLPDEREDEDEEQKENQVPLELYEDVLMDVELRPALRVCGDLALWTGSTSSHQGQEGVSVRLMFETVTGQSVSAYLELKNEGSTTIYYSWERLTQTHTLTQHFYFNSTTAVILPGCTKHISFIFKSASAGIMTEAWRLHTHPVLMGGASLRVTLRGVALEQDNSAQQRAALEKELEQKVSVSLCGRIVRDLLRGIHTPERPSSPADLCITDEELFNTLNPHLQYRREPVEALRGLWEQVSGSGAAPPWDLSLNTLGQALLSVSDSSGESRETSLSHFNTLILELQWPQIHSAPVTAQNVSVQLWRELLDGLVSESVRLRHSLGLQENNSWTDTSEQEEEELRGGALLMKDERRRASVRELEETRAVQEGGSMRKHVPEERKTDSSFTTDHSHTIQDRYRALLHTQVHVLMERMVDSLCDLLDDTQHTPQTAY
ncbi:MYCBP-associated protein [Sinocyclocheilus anshuiensis]|uniref:MYCBP-associated protein n=1 Tax=Sinocyclocheilus anshuiensis TaxID=1608454 RepID=UPI0007BACD8F|nr:PREDICTED: MYCBP-associated protein [Sinocyclocheilus anshuiensis]